MILEALFSISCVLSASAASHVVVVIALVSALVVRSLTKAHTASHAVSICTGEVVLISALMLLGAEAVELGILSIRGSLSVWVVVDHVRSMWIGAGVDSR